MILGMMFIYIYNYFLLWWYKKLAWKIRFKRVSTYAAQTFYDDKIIIYSTLFVKRVGSMNLLMNVIRHEIAHVIVDDEMESHGPQWLDCFINKLGGDGEVCTPITYLKEDYNYIAKCRECGYQKLYQIKYTTYCPECGFGLTYFKNNDH